MDENKKWVVWKLANEEGQIITTADGETEITGRVYDRADADLISAAPDLLEVVEEAEQVLEHLTDDYPVENLLNRMRAALRKARWGK